jgi:hypothetical protein
MKSIMIMMMIMSLDISALNIKCEGREDRDGHDGNNLNKNGYLNYKVKIENNQNVNARLCKTC